MAVFYASIKRAVEISPSAGALMPGNAAIGLVCEGLAQLSALSYNMANREEMHPGGPAQWRLAPPGGVLVTHSVTPNATQYNKNGFIAEVFCHGKVL